MLSNFQSNSNDSSFENNVNAGYSLSELQTKLKDNYPNIHLIAGPPLSRADLGHISWLFLHTMGAYYAEKPTEQRKRDLIDFWRSFSRLYPCGECAKHLRSKLKENPPNVESNAKQSQWLCELHNSVNYDLNKKNTIDCKNTAQILSVWKSTEFCGCENEFIEGVDGDR